MTSIVSPPSLTAPPPAPLTTDTQADFSTKAFNQSGWFTTMVSQMTSALSNVFNNATAAQERADLANGYSTAAANSATTAGTHVTSAQTARDLANSYAQSALNAPGTSGTSATSLAIGTGAKTLTTQTAKAWVVGQPVHVARTSAPATARMYGLITAYNAGTGSITVEVPSGGSTGSGTFSDWTISLTGPRSDVAVGVNTVTGTSQTAVAGARYSLQSVSATTVTMPTSPAMGDMVTIYCDNLRYDNVVNRNGQNIMGLAENMTLDDPFEPYTFIYITGYGWRFA